VSGRSAKHRCQLPNGDRRAACCCGAWWDSRGGRRHLGSEGLWQLELAHALGKGGGSTALHGVALLPQQRSIQTDVPGPRLHQRFAYRHLGSNRTARFRAPMRWPPLAELDRVFCVWGILPPRRGGRPLPLIYAPPAMRSPQSSFWSSQQSPLVLPRGGCMHRDGTDGPAPHFLSGWCAVTHIR